MFPPCTKSPDGRHNFNPETGDCAWQCGVNQRGGFKPAQQTRGMADLATSLARMPKRPPKGIHTQLHELVAELIKEYNEPPEIPIGTRRVKTFGYYLGKLKHVPISTIYMWRSEIRQSRDVKTPGKIFWWKYRKWKSEQKSVPRETNTDEHS